MLLGVLWRALTNTFLPLLIRLRLKMELGQISHKLPCSPAVVLSILHVWEDVMNRINMDNSMAFKNVSRDQVDARLVPV